MWMLKVWLLLLWCMPLSKSFGMMCVRVVFAIVQNAAEFQCRCEKTGPNGRLRDRGNRERGMSYELPERRRRRGNERRRWGKGRRNAGRRRWFSRRWWSWGGRWKRGEAWNRLLDRGRKRLQQADLSPSRSHCLWSGLLHLPSWWREWISGNLLTRRAVISHISLVCKDKLLCYKSCSDYECKSFLYHRKWVITLNIPCGQQSASVTRWK